MKKTYVSVKGVRFEILGPVDRRRSVEFSPHGRVICPSCAEGGPMRRYQGSFNIRWALEHFKLDHYRCTGCGWVGIVPGQHVTRSPNHRGPVETTPQPRPKPVRISDLARR